MDYQQLNRVPVYNKSGDKPCQIQRRSVWKMKTTTAQELLQKSLREGEKVLWASGTKKFPLLAKDASAQILAKWIGTVAVATIILYFYFKNGEGSLGTVAAIILVAAALVISPVLEQYNLMRQRYWITNQRAILMTANRTFYYLELREINDFQMVRNKGGMDCLVLGETIFEDIKRQMRWRSCHPKTEGQSSSEQIRAEGLIFFGVENAGAAEALLSQRYTGAAA